MKPENIKYVLYVQDMRRAVNFYTSVLGLQESFSSPHWSEVVLGDAIVGLHGGGDGSLNVTGLSLQYEDMRQIYNKALEAGATSIQKPSQNEGEPIILSRVRDAEGNEIMLTQYVG